MLKVSKKTDPRKTKEALGGGGPGSWSQQRVLLCAGTQVKSKALVVIAIVGRGRKY